MAATEALRQLREEAYCRVVKCFLAGEYSMVRRNPKSWTERGDEKGGERERERERGEGEEKRRLTTRTKPKQNLHDQKPQQKEVMLSKLRTELVISHERHAQLRDNIDKGVEAPWLIGANGKPLASAAGGGAAGGGGGAARRRSSGSRSKAGGGGGAAKGGGAAGIRRMGDVALDAHAL